MATAGNAAVRSALKTSRRDRIETTGIVRARSFSLNEARCIVLRPTRGD